MKTLAVGILLLFLFSCSIDKLYGLRQKQKTLSYEQITFQDMVKKYFQKDQSSSHTVEGIYSVTSVVTRKGRGLFSSEEKEKTTDRKENYAQVAIVQDERSAGREYIEIPLGKDFLPSYSIRGEFSKMAEGNVLVYKHFEPRGKINTYTFTYDRVTDILEGVRTENSSAATITYKLTYLKIYPKGSGQ